MLQKGYYENLTGVNNFNSELWEIYTKRPAEWPLIQETDAARLTKDFKVLELVPNQKITFHGAEFSTNRWGMRDQDYEKVPPPNTYRIALLGPSFVMGSGVADADVFEAQLERKLNEENSSGRYDRYEILNFGVAGYSALQQLYVFENEVLSFKPDALFFFGNQLDEEIIVRNFAFSISQGMALPYEFLQEVADQAGVNEKMEQSEIEQKLKPFGPEILSLTYQWVVEVCQKEGITPVWVFLPALETPYDDVTLNHYVEMAKEAGFRLINLSDVYDNVDKRSIVVAEWDLHPNKKGSELIAIRLYKEMLKNDQLLQMGLSDK